MQPPTKKPALADGTSLKPSTFSLPDGKRKSIMRDLGIHAATDPDELDKPPENPENLLELQVEKPQIAETNKDTRLVISFIKVENFKSYRGKHEIGPLHKNINVVSGANGSGKSNVMEAVLFCFGAAEATARCKKNQCELIYKGDGREREKSCMVEVTFHEIKDEDRHQFTCIPNTTFTIARQVFNSSGSSKYYFNGKLVTMQHNKDLLKRIGIDMDFNRSAILQGNIDKICLMQPDQLLEFLENYGETHRYMEPIEKLEKKVDELNVEFSNERAQYTAIQHHIPAYHKLAMENVECINTHNEFTMSQAKLHKYQIIKLEPEFSAAKTDCQAKGKEAEQKKEMLETKKKENTEANENTEKLMVNYKFTENGYSKIRKLLDKWLEEKRKRLTNLEEQEGDIRKFVEEITELQDNMSKMNLEATIMEKSITTDTRQLENLAVEISHLEVTGTQNFVDFEAAISNDKQILGSMEMELGAMKQNQAAVEGEYRVIEDRCQRMIVWDVEQELENLSKVKDDLNQLMEDHGAMERDLTNKLNEKTHIEQTASRTQLNELEAQLGYQNQKLGHIRHKLNITRNSSTASGIASCRSDKARRFMARYGRANRGIIGCLGDLVTTSKKYDKAISTLLGKNLESVLCETLDDSVAAINFLRANRLPKMTFIAREEARNWSEKGINDDRTKFPKPLIFDEIEFTEDRNRNVLRRIFFSFIHHTLVVENMAEYFAMDNRKEYNVITEDGVYCNRIGHITGGDASTGKIRLERGLNEDEKRRNIEQLELEEKQVNETIEHLKNQRKNQILSFEKLRKLEEDIANWQKEIRRKSSGIELSQQEIAIKKRMMTTKKPMTQEEFDQEQNSKRLKFQQLQQENLLVEAKEKERDNLQGKIDAVFNEIVGKPRKELEKLKKKSQTLEKQLAKSRVKLANHPKNLHKLEIELQEKEKDKKEAEEKHKNELEKNNEQFRKKGEDLNKAAEEKEIAYKTAQSEYEKALDQELKASRDLSDAELSSTKAEDLVKEARQQYILIGDQLEEHRQGLEACRSNFLDANSWDPKLQLELNQGSIILPDDVMEKLDQTFLERFEELKDLQTAGNLIKEEHFKSILEAKLQDLEKRQDKEGLLKYTMAKNALNDVFSSKAKSAKILHQHRSKLNQFRRERDEEISEMLHSLSDKVSQLYRLIVPGGNAMLTMVSDSHDDGVQFRIRPGGKTWDQLEKRSGGEKSLASLVLVLALLEFRSTPVFLMDEIDAALDFRVVNGIAQFLSMAKEKLKAQFLIVSHSLGMTAAGDRIVGIYKCGGVTETIIVSPEMVEDLVGNLARALAECDLSDRNTTQLTQDGVKMEQKEEQEPEEQ